MADLTISTAISLIDPGQCETFDGIPAETLSVGQPIYLVAATGKIGVADADAAGKQQFRGIVTKITGRAASFVKRGLVYGYDLSGMDFDDPVYLSDTAGSLADAAGTMEVIVGRVAQVPEAGGPKKAIYIDADWVRAWVASE